MYAYVLIFLIVVVLLLAWNFGIPNADPSREEKSSDELATKESFLAQEQEPEEQQKTYELVDAETPALRVGPDVLKGSKKLISWDSSRVHLLRNRFGALRILDRMEFQEGPNVIEVYRVVSSESLTVFVFPRADSNEDVIELKTQIGSEDPSDTPRQKARKADRDSTPQMVGIPSNLTERIRELDLTYSQRQTSSGPRAVDTHSS
jgi:hypothetical protein